MLGTEEQLCVGRLEHHPERGLGVCSLSAQELLLSLKSVEKRRKQGIRRIFTAELESSTAQKYPPQPARGSFLVGSRCPPGWPSNSCHGCTGWSYERATPLHRAWPIVRSTAQRPRPATGTKKSWQLWNIFMFLNIGYPVLHMTGLFLLSKMARVEQGALCFPVSAKCPELKGDTSAVQWVARCCPCVCRREGRATVRHSEAWDSASSGSRSPLLHALCLGTTLARAEAAGGARPVPLQANTATDLNCGECQRLKPNQTHWTSGHHSNLSNRKENSPSRRGSLQDPLQWAGWSPFQGRYPRWQHWVADLEHWWCSGPAKGRKTFLKQLLRREWVSWKKCI